MSYHYASLRIKYRDNTKYWKEANKLDISLLTEMSHIYFPYDPATVLLDIYSREIKP